jgi:hypothetical protein
MLEQEPADQTAAPIRKAGDQPFRGALNVVATRGETVRQAWQARLRDKSLSTPSICAEPGL